MKEEYNNIAYMSIKEIHINRIVNKQKNHEFRNYIPKNKIDKIFVYVPTPVKQLKYILEVASQIKAPQKIDEDGIGNKEFNLGSKCKYAYPIKHVYEIENPIMLEELKKKFGFTAPQAFAYASRYEELTDIINLIEKKRLY